MPIVSTVPSNHLTLCYCLLLLPLIFTSIRKFSSESGLCIRWPNYWSFSFSISPSNEYSGLISFRIDWIDLLAVQGILSSSAVLLLWLLLSHFSRVRQCDPIDGSPPGSTVPGTLQARTLEWVAISFSNA